MEQQENGLGQRGSEQHGSELASREGQLVGDLRRLRAEQRSVEDDLLEVQSREIGLSHKPNGAAAAAVFSASLGVFAIGLLTTLAAASVDIKNWLNWYDPTGPLSGKTTLGGLIWLVVWLGAHLWLGNREFNFTRVIQVFVALILAGLLLMFPPIFELLE